MAPPKKVVDGSKSPALRTVRVRVLDRGYWEHKLWEPGDVFDFTLPVGKDLPRWLEAVRGSPKASVVEDTEDDFTPTFPEPE